MAFPDVGILDNFNRADENPAEGWTGIGGSFYNVKVVSNQCKPYADVLPASAYYDVSEYGPNCQAYITASSRPSNNRGVGVIARSSSSGSGYIVVAVRNDTTGDYIYIRKYSSDTAISSIGGITFEDGDSIGIECNGITITAWYKPSGGSWAQQVSVDDSTYEAAGYVGLYDLGGGAFDDFGGGTYITSHVKSFIGVARASIQNACGVAAASISKICSEQY